MGPHPMLGVLIRGEKFGHRDTDRQEECRGKTEAETRGTCVQAHTACRFQATGRSQERGKEQILPRSLREELTL